MNEKKEYFKCPDFFIFALPWFAPRMFPNIKCTNGLVPSLVTRGDDRHFNRRDFVGDLINISWPVML